MCVCVCVSIKSWTTKEVLTFFTSVTHGIKRTSEPGHNDGEGKHFKNRNRNRWSYEHRGREQWHECVRGQWDTKVWMKKWMKEEAAGGMEMNKEEKKRNYLERKLNCVRSLIQVLIALSTSQVSVCFLSSSASTTHPPLLVLLLPHLQQISQQ